MQRRGHRRLIDALTVVSAERDELPQLVEDLPDEQLPVALAEVRRYVTQALRSDWPPPWFGAATASRTDSTASVDEIPKARFGRSG